MERGGELDISTRVESEINGLFVLKMHRYEEKPARLTTLSPTRRACGIVRVKRRAANNLTGQRYVNSTTLNVCVVCVSRV